MPVRKSHDQGGRRSQVRHGVENLGSGGLLWFALNRFDALSTAEATALFGFGMFVLSGLAKAWNEYDVTGRLLKRFLPALVMLSLLGCAGMVGTSTPVPVEGEDGRTIVAHKLEGVSWAFWDASIGQNVEGGTGGAVTVDLVVKVVETVGRILGGILSGVGGAGTAVTSASTPAPVGLPLEPAPNGDLFE